MIVSLVDFTGQGFEVSKNKGKRKGWSKRPSGFCEELWTGL